MNIYDNIKDVARQHISKNGYCDIETLKNETRMPAQFVRNVLEKMKLYNDNGKYSFTKLSK